MLPLTGVRVLDRTDGLGEMTARLLGDLGADVIRVEPAGSPASELHHAIHNANKRAAPAEAFDGLVDTADILITNAAGDLEALPARRPGLVIVAITDFGLTGPYRDWQATEAVHLALGAVLCRSGLPGREPLLPPGSLAYESAAAQAAWAALVAYYAGTGDLVDVSVYEATAKVLDPGYGIGGSATGGVPAANGPRGRPDARHLYPIFRCADGWVRICVLAPRQWQGMFRWLGEPEEFADPALASLHRRFAAAGRIYPAIGRLFATRTREQIVAEGQRLGVPTAALLTPDEVLEAEQFTARGAFIEVEGVRIPNGFVEIDGQRAGIRMPAPAPGQHTHEGFGAAPSATVTTSDDRPLAGLRVLDLGVIVVGAELGRLFADMGAEVIKVENKAFPDGSRQTFDGAPISPSFAYGHRNKLGLGLNLRAPEGIAIFKRLVAESDVVMSNFKPGTMESLGLGYAELAAINPGIVVADSSAFGPTGPWSKRMGYGPLVRATTGLSGLWRYPDDEDGHSDASTIFPDHVAARIEAAAILAKLIARRRDGRGGTVSVSQAEVILSQLWHDQTPAGTQGLYPCAGDDEWCVVSIRDDEDRRRLDAVLGTETLEDWMAARPPRRAMTELQAVGVPAAMMQRVPELLDDPHLAARGFFRTMHHPRIAEAMPTENGPAVFQRIADPPLEPAPLAGEHSRAILTRVLGMTAGEVDELIAAGIVEQHAEELV